MGLGVDKNPTEVEVDVDRAFVGEEAKFEYCMTREGVETGDIAYEMFDEDIEKEEGEKAKGFCGCGLDYNSSIRAPLRLFLGNVKTNIRRKYFERTLWGSRSRLDSSLFLSRGRRKRRKRIFHSIYCLENIEDKYNYK